MAPLIVTGLSLAAKYAPDIIRHFTNNETAATVAGQVIDIAQTVTGTKTPEAAEQALALNPELAMQFKMAVMANDAELQKAYLGDTQSARLRDIELAKAGIKNHRANVLAAAALLLVVVCLLIVVWSSGADDFAKATISLILGRALGWVEQLFSFEFGTTRASKAKDDTINRLSGA
jgi:hypothetical protein